MYDEIIKKLELIKDDDSPIEIRLYDHKNSRVAYKRLTYKEFFNIAAVLSVIKWMDIGGKQMDIKEFQNKSTRTINHDLTTEQLISNMCMGISGETGEVIDIIKKYLYQGHELNKEHVTEELGDVMFYITNLATLLGIDMQDVLQNNVDKLLKRYPDGFDINKSVNR